MTPPMQTTGPSNGEPKATDSSWALKNNPLLPFLFFLGGGSSTRIDYRKSNGTLILTTLLEDLGVFVCFSVWAKQRWMPSFVSIPAPFCLQCPWATEA